MEKMGEKCLPSDTMEVKKNIICNFSKVCTKIWNIEATALCLFLNAKKKSTEDPLTYVILCIYLCILTVRDLHLETHCCQTKRAC